MFSPLGVEDESIATGAGEGGDVTSTERMDSEIANFLKVRCLVTYMCSLLSKQGMCNQPVCQSFGLVNDSASHWLVLYSTSNTFGVLKIRAKMNVLNPDKLNIPKTNE